MASDAKIGLLLGLVFIFIIALIINGLPSFREDGSNNQLTTNMVSLQNNPPAIAAKERGVINLRESVAVLPTKLALPLPSADNQDIPIPPAAAVPESALVIKETAAEQAIAAAVRAVVAKDESQKTEPNEAILSKIYVVSEGDSLASIARKFYGSQQGSKKVNVTRIFDANRKLLKSPDEIGVGQKLIIPPLLASVPDKGKIVNVLSGTEFTKVESIGKRHLLANGRQAEQNSGYVVREGDSLWQIAAEQLGNGSRCSEIAELNAGVLDGEDNLSVGMRLKMPAR
jgi:nucleoid-associated protein YgaU